jgi:hypothetical protein
MIFKVIYWVIVAFVLFVAANALVWSLFSHGIVGVIIAALVFFSVLALKVLRSAFR